MTSDGERRRRNRVDRHQPGVDVGIAVPRADQPGGLDGLTAENAHRGCNDRDLQPAAMDVFRLTLHDFHDQLCKSRAPHRMLSLSAWIRSHEQVQLRARALVGSRSVRAVTHRNSDYIDETRELCKVRVNISNGSVCATAVADESLILTHCAECAGIDAVLPRGLGLCPLTSPPLITATVHGPCHCSRLPFDVVGSGRATRLVTQYRSEAGFLI